MQLQAPSVSNGCSSLWIWDGCQTLAKGRKSSSTLPPSYNSYSSVDRKRKLFPLLNIQLTLGSVSTLT